MFKAGESRGVCIIINKKYKTMVEANENYDDAGQEEQKTFMEEPAILDKFKAAAVITDGKSRPAALPVLNEPQLIE